MIQLLLRLSLFLLLTLTASACGILQAVEALIVGGTAAAQATADAAEQAESTLLALEHVLLLIPAYLAGEFRRPLWEKVKNHRNGKKLKASS